MLEVIESLECFKEFLTVTHYQNDNSVIVKIIQTARCEYQMADLRTRDGSFKQYPQSHTFALAREDAFIVTANSKLCLFAVISNGTVIIKQGWI